MSYPDSIGYQKRSKTSKDAAKTLSTAGQDRSKILSLAKMAGAVGVTGSELATALGKQNGTISARLIDLERDGCLKKTEGTRETASGKRASVYIYVSDTSTQKREPKRHKTKEKRAAIEAFNVFHDYMVKHGVMTREGNINITLSWDQYESIRKAYDDLND